MIDSCAVADGYVTELTSILDSLEQKSNKQNYTTEEVDKLLTCYEKQLESIEAQHDAGRLQCSAKKRDDYWKFLVDFESRLKTIRYDNLSDTKKFCLQMSKGVGFVLGLLLARVIIHYTV